jgi:hypothetical protein
MLLKTTRISWTLYQCINMAIREWNFLWRINFWVCSMFSTRQHESNEGLELWVVSLQLNHYILLPSFSLYIILPRAVNKQHFFQQLHKKRNYLAEFFVFFHFCCFWIYVKHDPLRLIHSNSITLSILEHWRVFFSCFNSHVSHLRYFVN